MPDLQRQDDDQEKELAIVLTVAGSFSIGFAEI
jgi:hypothetical protein